jgi:hypothetical protein
MARVRIASGQALGAGVSDVAAVPAGTGALHQRQVAAAEPGGGLEEHLAAASGVMRVTFAGAEIHCGRLRT